MLTNASVAKIDAESIVGIWLFEATNELAIDSSNNGNDGEIVGAKRVEGKIGNGLEFDGTNYVKIPANATTDDYLDGFTYLLWVKPLGVASGANVRLIERNWHNPTIHIGPTDFYGSVVFNGGIDNSAVRGGTAQIGEWSFIALTFDGTTLSLYADGEMVSDIKIGTPDFTNEHDGGSIWLAKWKAAAGWDFTGVIDEVGVFNVDLTEGDIKHIMEKGLSSELAVSPASKLTTTWSNIKTQ